ncbi:MAG: hypothetical protein J6A22_07300 [Bacteroidales bacterium]|nr:hypothetical protein [Bacteroidales bacterium]
MKRCNNCGWFNKDSALRCEKCDEDSFEPVIEEQKTESDNQSAAEPLAEPIPDSIPEDLPETNGDDSSQDNTGSVAKDVIKATVAFGAEEVVSKPVAKALAATVMDASAAVSEQVEETACPKCRYPIVGFVEYCPNCGATINRVKVEKKEEPENPKSFAKTIAEHCHTSSLKATVREIPEELVSNEDPDEYKLEPVDALGESPIRMKLDDVVVIGGVKYRFRK